ncbi:CheR family methyltransferase [Erythrobacter sp. W53]|uniref:CheR family methyltransferase n=1 Tax=Erythrobacter sp. W53 TaxID=3425947 RepID=UPI003D767D30
MAVMDPSYQIVADLLAARTGQHLAPNRLWRIPSALAGLFRDRGISNVDQLVCLLADAKEKQLATDVVEALLNNETYFFRDRCFFETLANTVLPDLAEKRAATRRLSIWSAGCSTGQEALSLAMLLTEQAPRWDGWQIEILGTDISGKAVKTAQDARYTQFEIQRGISVAQMLRFFDETEDGWVPDPKIASMTRFEQRNLLEPAPQARQFDLILCRNVLLYFEGHVRTRAFDRLGDSLSSDGWLMLGAGETIMDQTSRFEAAHCGSSLYTRNHEPPEPIRSRA